MKILSAILICISSFMYSQQMNNNTLSEILTQQADTIAGVPGNWQFLHKKVTMICITDAKNNRMRIISPVMKSDALDKDLLLDSLTANFHSALDVRYAIAHDILWVAFIHPLKELTTHQVEDAISQVYNANISFGTTFTSTPLLFNTKRKKESPSPKVVRDTLPKF